MSILLRNYYSFATIDNEMLIPLLTKSSFIKQFNYQLFKNAKGQVAVFIALLFQVLFLFFAIVVNVGLLVHHKINLQNSVDLAAYYGAMKQAEMLNAMAHINYQIRQSYKLMTWRYRVLGTAGEDQVHPFNNETNPMQMRSNANESIIQPTTPKFNQMYEKPYFCVAYKAFSEVVGKDNVCFKSYRSNVSEMTIRMPNVPPVIAGFIGLSSALRSSTQSLLDHARNQCNNHGAINYVTLAKFVYSYWVDQNVRKQLISNMSQALSYGSEDFYDLDGNLVSEGIKKTFLKNLTEPNKEGNIESEFKIYNGIADDSCGNLGVAKDGSPSKWLNAQMIMPLFYYVDFKLNSCDPEPKNINFGTPNNQNTPLQPAINDLKNYLAWPDATPMQKYIIGYEKDPWCMHYVGVKASSTPKIPFSPLGNIKIQARAFAKPFGGRFGPWNGVIWPQNVQASGRGRSNITFDPLLTKVVNNRSEGPKNTFDADFFPNFSRFPGDLNGLRSNAYLGEFAKYLWEKGASFADWENNIALEKADPKGDLLAMPGSEMRKLETMAIAPDIFDISYYSIEPDFYNLYFLRIRDRLASKIGIPSSEIRSDLGSNLMDQKLETFSIKDQIALVRELSKSQAFDNFQERFPAYVLDFGNLLTGWKGKNLTDYSLDTEEDANGAFGKCKEEAKSGIPTTGACAVGGRTGYSVKLISKDYLMQNDLELGGPNQRGEIRNKPPDDF